MKRTKRDHQGLPTTTYLDSSCLPVPLLDFPHPSCLPPCLPAACLPGYLACLPCSHHLLTWHRLDLFARNRAPDKHGLLSFCADPNTPGSALFPHIFIYWLPLRMRLTRWVACLRERRSPAHAPRTLTHTRVAATPPSLDCDIVAPRTYPSTFCYTPACDNAKRPRARPFCADRGPSGCCTPAIPHYHVLPHLASGVTLLAFAALRIQA